MTTENLTLRIDKLLAHIKQQLPERADTGLLLGMINPHLLTEQEVSELEAYVERVEPKIHTVGYRVDLSEFTNQDLDECDLWCKLALALEQEDREAAAKYRRYLNMSLEQLLTTFFAIPETSIPAYDQAPKVEVDGVTYSLDRTSFRSDKLMVERAIETNNFTGERDKMRRWCDTFPAQAAVA